MARLELVGHPRVVFLNKNTTEPLEVRRVEARFALTDDEEDGIRAGLALGPVIVAATIDVAAAIIFESTLSFLGLGFPPDIPSWGRLLYDAKDYLDVAPHWALIPGGAIFLTVLSISYMGDGLRDALDPRKVI